LEPKDTIAFLLTGEAATDVHTAYCLAHDQNRQYNPDYCDRLGIEMHKLPAVRSVTEILGVVTPRAAELTGLCPGTPVVTGTIDAFCDTIAGGALLPGKAVDVAGTSEIAALGVSTHEIPVHDVLKAQANPTHPTQPCPQGAGVFATRMGEAGAFFSGPSQAGGDTLRWLAEGFFPEAAASGGGLPAALPVLEKAAASCPPGCAGLVFVPYLCGERAPVWDSTLRGAFLGISIEHNRAYFARAVYEGVACVVRHILEACETASGQPAEQVVVCGGGSASRFWNQVKANILEKEVIPSAVQETAALGAAMIASVAVGAYPTLREASQRLFRAGQPVEPEPGSQEWARETYEKYLEYVRQRPRAEA